MSVIKGGNIPLAALWEQRSCLGDLGWWKAALLSGGLLLDQYAESQAAAR